jgi:SnoaL-like protein
MDELTGLLERERVIETITRLFVATDERDWPTVRACLTAEVLFDMRSLTGTPAGLVAADTIVRGWEEGLRPLRSVHHQAGNFRVIVDGESARAFCYGVAFHHRPHPSGRNTRTFVGSYDFHLSKEDGYWRIDQFRFNAKFVDGNLELEKP